MQVTIHAAKTQLSKLIQSALRGEEVIIANGRNPVVKLVPVERKTFKLGILKGIVAPPADDVFAPLVGSTWRRAVESRTLTALRDALLPKLISGELSTPNAERFAPKASS